MWLFGKKKETRQEPSAQELQVQAFARRFEAEEFSLVAVTGPGGLSGDRGEDEPLWTMTMPLTAWMDEEDGVVHAEPARLEILADDRLRDYLRQCLPGNFIIKARVRADREGGAFQLVGMPEPGFDPELKAILNEQVKPVTLDGEDLGTFTLNRSTNWFQAEVDWAGQTVLLNVDAGEEFQSCLNTARALLAQAGSWDEAARALAADVLLEQVNRDMEEDPVTREELRECMELESVQTGADGRVTLWYGGDLFMGQAVRIEGTVDRGPAEAALE